MNSLKEFVKNFEAFEVTKAQSSDLLKVTNHLQEKIRETIILNGIYEHISSPALDDTAFRNKPIRQNTEPFKAKM